MVLIRYSPSLEQPSRGKNTVRGFKKIILREGINTLSDADYQILLNNPYYAKLAKYQAVELIPEKAATKEELPALKLAGLNAKKSIELVEKTDSIVELEALKAEEKANADRKSVLTAIATQLKNITQDEKI